MIHRHLPTRAWALSLLLAMGAACWSAKPAWAQDDAPSGAQAVDFVEITPETRRAIARGLQYLASEQRTDGSYGHDRFERHVGITALAGMAFMADGHLPGRGEYGPWVERALRFVLDSSQETGLIAADTSHGPMYGHGFATLFLAEIYGMTPEPRVREALVKAVRLIVVSQNPEGGWRYSPQPIEADISVTICQIMALRAARNAGVSVPKETIDRAILYVRNCQDPSDGGFRYRINSGPSAFPRSAAGVASLYYAGIYDDHAVRAGLAYMNRFRSQTRNRTFSHYYYGHYYAVQAMYLAGGEHWRDWYPSVREEFIEKQESDGSWSSNHGNQYATAMSLLVLQTPNRYMPIFQR